ncbi:titin-like isoform X2 [Pectinophora gossypiella]|nr:titin-like isoform X2 [Pectinophora gossypiella]
MNDISVKIVESPKVVEVAESPVTEPGDNDVDPLAIEDDAGKVKDSLSVDDQATSCDENAKEESPSGSQNDDSENLALQTEKVKAELLKEDSSSINSALEESVEANLSPSTINNVETTVPTPEPEPSTVTEEPEAEAPALPDPVVEEPVLVQEPPPAPVEVKEVLPQKEPSPAPEVPMEAEVQPEEKPTEVEIKEVAKPVEENTPVVEKEVKVEREVIEEKVVKEQKETKPKVQPVNGDISKVCKEEQATKRRACDEVDTESPLKKLCQEVEKTFPQHDIMINDYIQNATKNNVDEIQRHTEQLLAEIQTLRELAQKKEHEWNNILHLKKVKEEILLRLLRRKQVLSFEKSAEINGSDRTDPFDYLNQAKNLAIDKSDEISGLAIKQPGSSVNPMIQAPVMPVSSHFNPLSGLPPPYDKAAHMQMPKPVFQPMMMPGPMPGFPRDMNGQLPTSFGMPMGRQGPTKDVKSIIADYRQRNPEVTPRRGRRMKSILNPGMMNAPRPIAPKVVDSLNNMNNLNNLNMLFNNLDMNQKAMLERLQQIQAGGLPNSIFKDALVQFANMQQANAGLIPPRPTETMTNRPEHHVKERRRPERNHEEHKQPERMPSTSPRLPPPPPYPEISLLPVTTSQETQSSQQNSLLHGILTKNCGEITITPVQPAPAPEPQPEKTEEVVQLDDEESPAASEGSASGSPGGSTGRLVIDEGGADAGDAPLCQGCRRRDAQFVCAGCANQWYCSRDCQVAAWDDHSEMCSG